MQGRELKYLAGVAELARLDLEKDAAALTLESGGSWMEARYRGAYSGGWRVCSKLEMPSFHVMVNASNFLSLINLIADDDEIVMQPAENTLTVIAGGSSMRFPRQAGEPLDNKSVSPEGYRAKPDFAARVSAATFVDELGVAVTYVAPDQIRPTLTGVRIDVGDGKVGFTAFDGFAVLFKSAIPAKTMGEGSMVVPVDYLSGAKLVQDDGDLLIARVSGTEVATIQNGDGSAFFRSGLLLGGWPGLTQIENMPMVGDRLTLLADQLKVLQVASQSFKMQEVLLHTVGGRTSFQIESDTGSLTSRIPGKVSQDIYYDLTSLAKVARMGSRLEILVPPTTDLPTIARSEHRTCWLTARVH